MTYKVVRDVAPIQAVEIGNDLIKIYPHKDHFYIEAFYKDAESINSGELENLGKALIELANQGSYRDPHKKE